MEGVAKNTREWCIIRDAYVEVEANVRRKSESERDATAGCTLLTSLGDLSEGWSLAVGSDDGPCEGATESVGWDGGASVGGGGV